MRKILVLLVAICAASPAFADWTGKDATGATITFKNPNVCSSVVCVPISSLVDATGAAVGTAGAPLRIDPTGTTPQSVTESGTWTVQPGNTPNTAAWLVSSNPGTATSAGTVWTSATGSNTTQALMSSGGWPALVVQLKQTTTLTAGQVTFEGTYDGTFTDGPGGVPIVIPIAQIVNPNTFANLTNPYTLVASTNQSFLVLTQGYQQVRLRLTTVITGTGSVTPQITLLSTNPAISAILNPLVTGANIIGKVGIDQTLDGTTNAVRLTSQYPSGATPITASATGTTAATTATLAGTGGKTTYICSYSIRANATAATTVTNTVTGVITGTMSHIMWVAPAASGLGVDEQIFSPCVPASATNTAIAVVSGAPGTGGLVSSTATGYQQ
jgi:hypothetical protein